MSHPDHTTSLSFAQYLSMPLYVVLVFGTAFALGKLFSGDFAGLIGMWKLFLPVGVLLFILSQIGGSSKRINRKKISVEWYSDDDNSQRIPNSFEELRPDWMNISDPVTGDIFTDKY